MLPKILSFACGLGLLLLTSCVATVGPRYGAYPPRYYRPRPVVVVPPPRPVVVVPAPYYGPRHYAGPRGRWR